MTITKTNKKKLAKAMENAAKLANAHVDATRKAQIVFHEVFGEDVPEEFGNTTFPTPTEKAASLFNEYVSYGENMSEKSDVDGLIDQIIKEMEKEE